MAEKLEDFEEILKKVRRLRKGDFVMIIWEDAKAFKEDPFAEIVDVGFVVDVVKGKLIITSERGLAEHFKVAIPLGCIKSIKKVKVVENNFEKMSYEKDFTFKSLVSELPLEGFLLKARDVYHVRPG
ncbi:MAG: hypothetical protein ACKD6N_03470 [Candidatus Bathyarchaeota archaeon]